MIGSSVGTTVQIRCLKLADETGFHESLWNCGSREEQVEANRFRFAPDRNRNVAGQAFLRGVPGAWLDCARQAIQIVRGPRGKPLLASQGEPNQKLPNFTLSRCNSSVAVAIVRSGEVGVDSEDRQENINSLQIAREDFSAAEIRWLQGVPAAQLKNRFTCLWKCRDVFAKAPEMGLGLSLNEFSVDSLVFETATGRVP